MAIADQPNPALSSASADGRVAAARPSRPVIGWAVCGAFFLALAVYIWVSWFANGHAHHVGTGATPVPGYMQAFAWIQQVGMILACAALVWRTVLRPYRREGKLSWDGLFVLAFFLVWWQDPLFSYFSSGFSYNSAWVNLGSWAADIPGWQSPNGQLNPEPILIIVCVYPVWFCAGAIGISNLMRRAGERWPQLSTFRLVAGTWLLGSIAVVAIESFFMRSGLYTYGIADKSITLFAGKYYQFPIYEAVFCGGLWTAWACLRYFRDDRGLSIAERGIDNVDVGTKGKTAIRFLALLGISNVIFLLCYSIPVQWFVLKGDAWPQDIQKRSYLTNGVCGPGTSYACAGPGVPIPRGTSSVHVTPEGKIVVPRGTTLPRSVSQVGGK